MKYLKHGTLRILLPILFALFSSQLIGQGVPIKNSLYGQNAWLITVSTPTDLNQYLPKMKLSGAHYCRIGGIAANFGPIYKWNPSTFAVNTASLQNLIGLIDTLRGSGLEPIIEMGYNPVCTNTVTSPLGGVTLANQALLAGNVVAALKSYYGANSPKYFIIANEPNLAIKNCNYSDSLTGYSYGTLPYADTIAAYIKEYAKRMRAADSTITIIGPEITSFGNDSNYVINQMMAKIIKNQTTPAIMGKMNADGFNRYYIDIISYHDYLQSASTLTDIVAAPTKTANGFRTKLTSPGLYLKEGLIDMILLNGAGRNIYNTRLACTEFNIDLRNGQSEASGNYSTVVSGYDNRSFVGGQWLADVYSQAMELSATNTISGQPESWMEFMTPWSFIEGDCNNGIGFLSACSTQVGRERPMYYHYQLLTQNFIGRFYRGTSGNPNIKAFASAQTPYGFKILVLNQDQTTDYHCQFNTIGNTTSTVSPYNARFDFNFTGDPSITITSNSVILTPTTNPIQKQSTVLLVFDCYGDLVYRRDYLLSDAQANDPPHLRQIGNQVVDGTELTCGLPGAIGGTLSTNTAYSNATISVSSDITLATGVSLTFDNCLVIMAAGTKIKTTTRNAININKTVMIGCEGKTWGGIDHQGTYSPGESLTIDSSAIIFADYPAKTYKVPSINLTYSSLIQGKRAVDLEQPKGFTIKNCLLAGFGSGIYSSNAVAGNQSYIDGNYTMECDTSLKFVSSSHDSLYVTCNRFEFKTYGIFASSTTLKDFGTSSVGAGNRFIKTTSLTQSDFIELSGSTPIYYYDPKYSTEWSNPVTNLSQVQATNDRNCPSILTETCGVWPEVGVQEIPRSIATDMNIYPNPSKGTFNLACKDAKGMCNLTAFDATGRMILNRKVDFTNEKTISFNLQGPGIYFVTVQNSSSRVTKKVIVE
jgi:hypothetical protein